MDNLISRSALLDKCRQIIVDEWNKRTSPESWADAYEAFIEDIEEAPAVDAVPVVRCKDCLWSKEYNVVGDCWCMNPLLDCNNLLPPGAFCSYGERKDNA